MNHKNHSSDKGYKQTEVGMVPEDWEAPKLGKVSPLQFGFGLS